MKKQTNKDRSLTIRLSSELYKKCIIKALETGTKRGEILKISDIIRMFIEEGVK